NCFQGLRAVAILSVLLFHLKPKLFRNGFLGVDVFFVLSGYLMSWILSREHSISGSVILTFYFRRFKRIVPLYALMLFVLTIVTSFIFIPTDIPHFETDMIWALPFAENMQNVLKKYDYWEQVFNSPLLLHAWSLGVEIQHYLIVPFIMIIHRNCGTQMMKMAWIITLICGSFLLHSFASSTVSFGFLLSRVWLFLIGTVFFELE
ncbi:hypothetical protein PENTCL1PPCAC_6310, partial [Pristionchus entomophagus]